MAKKKTAKTDRTNKAPLEPITAEPKVQAAGEDSVDPLAEKIEAEPPKAAEEQIEKLPQTEPANAVQEERPQPADIETTEENTPVEEPAEIPAPEDVVAEEPTEASTPEQANPSPRRSVVFIGSECYPFVKTGGLGDVMYALPKALVKQNCDVKVILPRYKCIPWEYQQKMIYRGSFQMDLCADGRSYYVGIMEYVWDGVVYDFIDNEEFFSWGNPYTNLIDDIPKYCYFAKAALAALNYMDWIPDIIHCHDWQAALVPVYLRTLFANTRLNSAKTILRAISGVLPWVLLRQS